MHSLGEEVVLDLNAEWRVEDDDGQMIVDSHEEDWSRLHDVKVTGTVSGWKHSTPWGEGLNFSESHGFLWKKCDVELEEDKPQHENKKENNILAFPLSGWMYNLSVV